MSENSPAPRPATRQRYAVLSGSLGLGNLGDDALAGAFLSQHGGDYHGVTVLSSGVTRSVPGVSFVAANEQAVLPESRSVLPLPALGGRLGPLRSLPERVRTSLALQKLAGGAPIDYVWLGGLLGLAPHIELRSRELRWAGSFASRFVYYFGDVSVAADAHASARELTSRLRDVPNFVAVRSAEAAAELAQLGFPNARVGIDAVLFQYSDPSYRRQRSDMTGLVINPCSYDVSSLRPLWLGMAGAAARRGMPVTWVSFADADDLPLCKELKLAFKTTHPSAQSTLVSSDTALAALRAARVTVATRFHAHIFSLCFGVPTISVSYGSKTRRLFDELGLAEWRMSAEALHESGYFDELLERAVRGDFATPEATLAEARRRHGKIVTAFSQSSSVA